MHKPLAARLGVTVRLASGELLINTPAIAGGRQGVPHNRRTPLVGIPVGPRMLPNSVHPSRLRAVLRRQRAVSGRPRRLPPLGPQSSPSPVASTPPSHCPFGGGSSSPSTADGRLRRGGSDSSLPCF